MRECVNFLYLSGKKITQTKGLKWHTFICYGSYGYVSDTVTVLSAQGRQNWNQGVS